MPQDLRDGEVFSISIRVDKIRNCGKLKTYACRGVAQPGSAPALGAGGPRFESGRPDQFICYRQLATVALGVISTVHFCHAGCRILQPLSNC
jgi:hypothetical protein